MNIMALCGLALISLISVTVIRELKPAVAPFCAAASGIVIIGYAVTSASPVIDFLKKMDPLAAGGITLMIKALGIAVVSQITAEICRDCGESAFASKVELAAKINILLLAMPLITDIVTIAGELAG